MSDIVTSDIVVISSGVVSSGMTAGLDGEIDVLTGGTLTDSLADGGWIVVDNGGTVQNVSATARGDVFINGSASDLTAENMGMFDIDSGGTLDTGLVKSSGMGAIYAGGAAKDVTVLEGGKFLNNGGTVQNTNVMSGGSFTVQFATANTADTSILDGATMRIVSAGNATDTTVNGGFLEIESGIAANTVVSAGSMRVNKSNTVEGVKLLGGQLEINEATANATVVSGGSMRVASAGSVSGTTMTDGFIDLFSGTAAKTVISGGAMNVYLFNSITDTTLNNGELTLSAASANTTVVNGGVMQVTSGGTLFGTTVNAGQLTMNGGTLTDTTILGGSAALTGTTVSNIEIGSGGIVTMDSESTLAGISVFTEGASITVDGTVEFDTGLTTAENAQITGYSAVTNGANAVYTLTVPEAKTGLYLLASDAAAFNSSVTFGEVTLNVGAEAVKVDTLYYMLLLTGSTNDLTLSISVDPPEPTVPLRTYVNSEWVGLPDETIVPIVGGSARIGYNAFAALADAITAVVEHGIVEIVGGTVSFADGYSKTITVDAGATVVGKAVFATPITVNGTVAFDTANATAEAAQFEGFSKVSGKAAYTLTDEAKTVGTYLLAADAAGFSSDVVFGDVTLSVGGDAVKAGELYYTLGITDNNELALTVSDTQPGPPTPTLAYVNSEWSGKADGEVVPVGSTTATIGYDAFATLEAAIAGTTDDGRIDVVGGEITFGTYSKTVTVDAGATVVGKNTFDKAITINGTNAFDTAVATAEATQFTGRAFTTGDAAYTLTVATPVTGTYLLADNAAGFNSDVVFGDVTLKVGAEAAVIGDFTYALAITDNNDLALVIADKPTPPPPATYFAKSDIDGNGISDVMFVWTGNNYQHGFWMNGTSTWQSAGSNHPADWENLGCYDMNTNGKADSVMVGNVEVSGVKGAYIGFYLDAIDNPDGSTWQNIGYLNNADDIAWQNTVGNLTGNEGANSIVWYAPELYALGAWTDGTDSWITVSSSFGGSDWTLVGCGDFDGDGKDSVLMSGLNGQYFYSVGIDGTATSLGSANWSGWEVRAIGDFSGDGKDDLVLFHLETGSMVMCADGSVDSFVSLAQLDAQDWFVVGAGDYNGDRKDDLLVRQYSTGMLGYYDSGDTARWVELGRGVDMDWTVIAGMPTSPQTEFVTKSDIDGNGISDVMFVWTGNNYQHGFWMNGTSEWQSAGSTHPADWENLGCFDMDANGKADSVLVGNVVVNEVKGAYIGFYADAIDNPDGSTWVNIGYLNNADDIAWKNKVGNLTGNENANSIVWYAPELYAVGAWTDGTDSWVTLSNSFGGFDWTLVGCGDFDGDGKDSVLMSGLNGQYFYSVGIDGAAQSLGSANWSGWEVRAIGDFSGDGKDDLVLFHLATGSMVMCADGSVDSFVSLAQLDAEDWFVVGAGDYNGDQKDDLLVRQYSTGMLGYYNSGDTAQWVELGRGVDMNWTVIA